MKPTAIIRYVDDLGRVAIPKDIREQLDIRAGTPVEFYISGEDIIIKKQDKGATENDIHA